MDLSIGIDHEFPIDLHGLHYTYILRGIIYFGNQHFSARIILNADQVWYHDGISTGAELINEGALASINLSECQGKTASIVFYERR